MVIHQFKTRNDFIVDNLNEIAIISETDKSGIITRVNENFVRISGYTESELVGKTHRVINSGFHQPEFFEKMWSDIREGKIWRGEVLNSKKNGELYWVDSSIFPVFDDQNNVTGFMSIRYDITERMQLKERELAQSRLKVMGELTAQILHDIKNPLSIIMLQNQILMEHLLDQHALDREDFVKRVQAIEKYTHRIIDIMSNMQALMHGSYAKNSINIAEEVETSIAFLQERLQEKAVTTEVVINGPKETFSVIANKIQVQQVIINLINNSIDAIEAFDERWVKVEVSLTEKGVFFSVIDSGKGIDPSIQDRIFNSIFTTKKMYKGTGLGLGICRRIVETFGGSIKLRKDYSHTCFDIFLPFNQ